MDKETINIYNQDAESIALLHGKLAPERLYQLANQFFIRNGKTLDIGCGMGRDTAWLFNHGFPTIGIDPSRGMLEQAIKRYPNLCFIQDALPELSSIADAAFHNIFCSAVLMHLRHKSQLLAIFNILRLLKNDGVLIISFRATKHKDCREKGKLYEKINFKKIINYFQDNEGKLLLSESSTESGRNHIWHNLVFKK
jgi:ubiquinone/menaquinone biosynthesis C-methylase UbiE